MELVLENITKKFGEVTALDNVSISFRPGIYGILGPNGAGKSTLIHLITDNVARGEGSICYDGTEILKMGKAFRRRVGFMPQEQGFYGYMSAKAFLRYMADVKGLSRKKAKTEVDRLLKVVNLERAAHRRVGGFSGGMRQRVMLAQALLGDPDILILDEPTAGLDPKERVHLREFVSGLSKDKIVLWTTHVVSDIESIADRVLIIDNGKVLAEDSPERIVEAARERMGEPEKTVSLEDAFLYCIQA